MINKNCCSFLYFFIKCDGETTSSGIFSLFKSDEIFGWKMKNKIGK